MPTLSLQLSKSTSLKRGGGLVIPESRVNVVVTQAPSRKIREDEKVRSKELQLCQIGQQRLM